MKTLRADAVERAMQQHGFSASALAERLGVSKQAVSNWLNGRDTPRPDKLLRLSLALKLSLSQILETELSVREPVVAYRMTTNRKAQANHLDDAKDKGQALEALVPYLPYNSLVAPPQLLHAKPEYRYVQSAAASLRAEMGLKDEDHIEFEQLIGQFRKLQAVIVPSLWGKKRESHANALHIYLPDHGSTWVYLNLDTNEFDFMFWMAHELAHSYTSELCGTEEGEDFADMLASALLFPEACAKTAYETLSREADGQDLLEAVVKQGLDRNISVYTVFTQTNAYAQEHGLKPIDVSDRALHGMRRRIEAETKTIREIIFDGRKPAARKYIAGCEKTFQTPFFHALAGHIQSTGAEASFVQHVLGIPFADAKALHAELLM